MYLYHTMEDTTVMEIKGGKPIDRLDAACKNTTSVTQRIAVKIQM